MQYETRAHYNDPEATPSFLDGTVLSAGYVTEMVLQSQYGELDFLPALPDAWATGEIRGIRARGGLTVDIAWKQGKLVQSVIVAEASGFYKLRYQDQVRRVFLEKGVPFTYAG